MRVTLAFLIALAAGQSAIAEDVVVIGRLVYNEPMDYVKTECPQYAICMRSWWKSVVDVRKVIRGSHLTGRVATAVMQHTSLDPSFKKNVRLFVLKKIVDPGERAKLRVDYYLEEMAEPAEMFCLLRDPKEVGLDVESTYVAGTEDDKSYCFELPIG
jgi:hypothetical protein